MFKNLSLIKIRLTSNFFVCYGIIFIGGSMYNQLKNDDIVITDNKLSVLNYLSENKKILNLKIMTLKEFKDKYFGTYDEKAIYYLVDKYNYKYDVAKLFLDNFLFDDKLKKELIDNDLIIYEPLFKESIKRIVIINQSVDLYVQKEIEKYENIKLNYEDGVYKPSVYQFENIEDEINFVCISISKLLKNVDINRIKLVNVTSEYELPLIRMFDFYNIPINLNIKKKIYGTNSVQQFLLILKQTNSYEEALTNLPKDEIYNVIVDVCNKYRFKEIDNTIIYLIESELKNSFITDKKLENAIDVISFDEMDDGYYFVLGFNQGSVPIVYKDEDYLNDKEKEKLGILTSYEKNKIEKNKIKNILSRVLNITISYKLKTYKDDYYKSPLIDEFELEVKSVENDEFNYSNRFNKISLAKKLDKLIKFNEKDKDLNLLYSSYKDIKYMIYNNTYKMIDKDLFYKYIKDNLLLSYTSLDNFNRCGFRYYLANVLKVDKYEETFMTYIGNLFHYILSIAFEADFDFELEFNKFINERQFTNKERFFINKLKNDLLFTIETIKKQDSYTELDQSLNEQKIYVNKDKNIKVTFMGIIDKLKYGKFDGKTIVAIIDYKTGSPEIDLDNMYYGISMQLPIYLYLANHTTLSNVVVSGFYLQKIVHNKLNYQEGKDYDEELSKLYRLEGYSNSDISILSKLDNNYDNSYMIKGMKTSSKGFYAYSKVLSEEQLKNINIMVDEKIDNSIDDILNVKFDINPKRIDNLLKGCEYCKFKDICYMKEEDIVDLKKVSYKEFLGGDDIA